MIIARMLGKGQIVIPKELRVKAHIGPGDKLEVRVTEEGIIISRLSKSYTDSFTGIVKGSLSLQDLEWLHAGKS
jgi:AbrB family looped-hinge helix DNA binding protein